MALTPLNQRPLAPHNFEVRWFGELAFGTWVSWERWAYRTLPRWSRHRRRRTDLMTMASAD